MYAHGSNRTARTCTRCVTPVFPVTLGSAHRSRSARIGCAACMNGNYSSFNASEKGDLMDSSLIPERERRLDRYLKVWQGEAPFGELDTLTADGYVGHIGSRSRDLAGLRADIVTSWTAAPAARFMVEPRFAQDARMCVG